MVDRIIRASIQRGWLVMLLVLGVAVVGFSSYQRRPIDAVADITNVQVQINTEAPGYTPLEAEQRVTFLVETAMSGLPQLEYTRSLSRYGLSQVTVVFEDGTDIYFARQLVSERVQAVEASFLGGNRTAEMGAVAVDAVGMDREVVELLRPVETLGDRALPVARKLADTCDRRRRYRRAPGRAGA